MPAPNEILAQLSTMSRELAWLALAWHAAILLAIAVAIARGRPSARTSATWLAAPLASVAAAAFAYGNPFNGISFAVLAIIVVIGGTRVVEEAPASPIGKYVAIGILAFGLVYPHFAIGPWYSALYAAPAGVVPCPTLATVAGLYVLARPRSRTISAALMVWTVFYALFGMFRLGVAVDAGLLVAGALLMYVEVEWTLHDREHPVSVS